MAPSDDEAMDSGSEPASRIAELERRQDSLRRRLRRLRLAMAGLAVAASVPLVMAATADRTRGELEVEELRIVDGNGTPRLVLGTGDFQEALFYGQRIRRPLPPSAAIVFKDADGQEMGALAVPDRGGLVMGLDSKTGQNGAITVTPDGTSANIFFRTNRGGDHALQIGVSSDAGPYLRMTRGGEPVLRLPRPENGNADEAGGEGSDE